ncbi:MAG: ubiquinol-cytochrome C chaperone family protein [Magnetococcus sp. XQGC-1]
MLWFDRLSPKKQPQAAPPAGEPRLPSGAPLSRPEVITLHGRIVDRVLRMTEGGWGIPDTFDLRFDVMIFWVSALLRHLHGAGPEYAPLSQMLWDITFEGLEESLRDRGVTDIRIASKMRKLLQDATGRRNAYLAAWEDPAALRVVIARNIFNGADPDDPRIDTLLANLPGFAESVLEPCPPISC